MQYALLIYTDEEEVARKPPEEHAAIGEAFQRFNTMLAEKQKIIAGHGLMPVATAKQVQVKDGEVLTTDGPFAETKEQLGGFYLLDCNDLDEALEYAAQIPPASYGSIEVRPVMVFERPS